MKREKGFTLIELLAVIVILAIIALIATPIILNMINDAKKSAAKDSAYGYIEAIEYNNSMANLNLNNGYTKIADGSYDDVTILDVKVKGTTPTSGTMKIESGRVTEANLCINNYSVHYDGTTATIEENACDGTLEPTEYTVYENGTAVYYNPVDGTKCSASEAVSTTGTKIGCMKFYTFNDEGKNASIVNMILDHNTTEVVAWNSSGNNADGMNEVKTALESDTTGWKETARLITAEELAEITGNTSWDRASYFYFETGSSMTPSLYTGKYAWLYDYIYDCTKYGCSTAASSTYGYWTSTPVVGFSLYAWMVSGTGSVGGYVISDNIHNGIRPVITISKSIIS